MPDPSLSDALAEAAALAPSDELFRHTLEIRHPDFIDEEGHPDSLWLTADTEGFSAPLEADAPVRPGETVPFTALAFSFALMAIEPGITPEIEITIDGVSRAVVEQLDKAAESAKPIVVAYRPYLDSALGDGPQMIPVPTWEIVDVTVGLASVTLKARTGVDLRGGFPVRRYTITEFPGLAGR